MLHTCTWYTYQVHVCNIGMGDIVKAIIQVIQVPQYLGIHMPGIQSLLSTFI